MAANLERRFKQDEASRITCRVCFGRVDLTLERFDESPMYVYYRCQLCEQWFPVRRADLERLKAEYVAG